MLGLATLSYAEADSRTHRVDQLFKRYNQPESPGCAVGVIRDGEPVHAKGYGMASIELGVPNTTRTVYEVGSLTKPFVAASILIAAKQGHLSLDDDIRKFLPEMPDYGTPVTVRHLIHHTSGLRDYMALLQMMDLALGELHSRDEILALIARQKELNFVPGDEFLYSNTGYFLLAQIIERATGKSLRAFADENIFEPLGMKQTHFHDDRYMIVPNRAMAYAPVGEGRFVLYWDPRLDQVGPMGLYTTVEDLFRWDRIFDSDAVGGGGIVEQMLRPGLLNDGTELDYLTGLKRKDHKGLEVVYHEGGIMGFLSLWLRFPEQKFSLTLLCNAADANAYAAADGIIDAYLGEDLQEEKSEAADEETETLEFIELPEEVIREFEGGYRGEETALVVKATYEDGALIMTSWDRGPIHQKQLPVSERRFRSVGGLHAVELEFDDAGVMHMFGDGERIDSFHPVELFTPTTEEMAAFVGRYFSEELQCIHTLAVDGGTLTLSIGRLPAVSLEPTCKDAFRREHLQLEFSRDDEGKVDGYSARRGLPEDPGRGVKNIRFRRMDLR